MAVTYWQKGGSRKEKTYFSEVEFSAHMSLERAVLHGHHNGSKAEELFFWLSTLPRFNKTEVPLLRKGSVS
jgi:hypothetical protein